MIRQTFCLDWINRRNIDAEQDDAQLAQPGDRLGFEERNPVWKSCWVREAIRFQQDPARFGDLRTCMLQISNGDGRLSPGELFHEVNHDRRSDVIFEWNGIDGGPFSVEMKRRVRVRSVVRTRLQCTDIDRARLAKTPG